MNDTVKAIEDLVASVSADPSKATETLLAALHGVVVKELLLRIARSEASAADIGAAIKMLKDNNITADMGANDGLQELAAALKGKGRKNVADRAHPRALTPTEVDEVIDGIRH